MERSPCTAASNGFGADRPAPIRNTGLRICPNDQKWSTGVSAKILSREDFHGTYQTGKPASDARAMSGEN